MFKRSMAVLMVATSVLGPVTPALAADVQETRELKLLESVIAVSGEKSAELRKQVIEAALSAYLEATQGVSEQDRGQNFAAAAQVLGLGTASVQEVGAVFKDAVIAGKDLGTDQALEKNLGKAFSRLRLPAGAEFDSSNSRCEQLRQVAIGGVIVGVIGGIVALGAHAGRPCLAWSDGYYSQWCGYDSYGFYSCTQGYYSGVCRQYGSIDPSEESRMAGVRTASTVVAAAGFAASLGSYIAWRNSCR